MTPRSTQLACVALLLIVLALPVTARVSTLVHVPLVARGVSPADPYPTPTATATATPTATLTPTPTRTLTPTPTSTPSPADVRIVPACCQVDPEGNDVQHLDQEYVCFENRGGLPADLTGWQVKDLADHTYTFGIFVLQPGALVRLRTGKGQNTATDLYWGLAVAVWNNDHDTVLLYDSALVLVDQYAY